MASKFSTFAINKLIGRKSIHTGCQCLGAASSRKVIRRKGILKSKEHQKPVDSTEIVYESLFPSTDILLKEDYFKVKELVTIEDLFNARVHYGHKQNCRNPFMTPYLYGSRVKTDIFDLEQTLENLHAALNIAAHIAYRKGVILFVSRDKQTMPIVEAAAHETKEYAHCRFWKGGLYSNSFHLFGVNIRLPDLCIFINTNNNVFRQHLAVKDSARMLIPTIGIVDSNCDPRLITYPIPGSDDGKAPVELYCKLFTEAILRGKGKRSFSKL